MQLLLGYLFRCFDHAFAHNAKCRDNFINSFDASIITWNVILRRGADELSNRAAINSIQLKPIHCTIAHGHVRSRQTRFTFNFRLFFCLRFHSWHLRKKITLIDAKRRTHKYVFRCNFFFKFFRCLSHPSHHHHRRRHHFSFLIFLVFIWRKKKQFFAQQNGLRPPETDTHTRFEIPLGMKLKRKMTTGQAMTEKGQKKRKIGERDEWT